MIRDSVIGDMMFFWVDTSTSDKNLPKSKTIWRRSLFSVFNAIFCKRINGNASPPR